jgi:hypothetical protein
MIRLEDRQVIAQAVEQAHKAGARLKPACELLGIDLRTLQRWKATDGLVRGDRRPEAVREGPAHALSEAERARLLQVANEPRFADVPPARIAPMLAPMTASTWPPSRAFAVSCVPRARVAIAAAPRRHSRKLPVNPVPQEFFGSSRSISQDSRASTGLLSRR